MIIPLRPHPILTQASAPALATGAQPAPASARDYGRATDPRPHRSRPACLLLCLLLYLAAAVFSGPAAAQVNLTPEQLNQLQSLTPAQRQALMDNLDQQAVRQPRLSESASMAPREAASEALSPIERSLQRPLLSPGPGQDPQYGAGERRGAATGGYQGRDRDEDAAATRDRDEFAGAGSGDPMAESAPRPPQRFIDLRTGTIYTSAELLLLQQQPPDLRPSNLIEISGSEGGREDYEVRQAQDLAREQAEAEPALRQFGYELFAGAPSTFAPATDIPVPADYVMGPGDNVIIQLYGQENVTHDLVVTREGSLLFPEIGPISVAGLTFDELRQQINDIVNNQLIGQRASVTLGTLRSIRIFVLGEAYRPGSYTVSSLATMTNALFASGGINKVGSLRNIQLRRQGQTVAELDLYDLLLRGDTSGDQRLQPDDVLFIPPIGATVGIAGEVIRPAIYELKDESSAAEVIGLAGGLLPTAFPAASTIDRIDAQGLRTVLDVNLAAAGDATISSGDLIRINPVLETLENVIVTEGHLQRPGGFQWRDGLRVSDVIGGIEALLPNPDLDYALLLREVPPARSLRVLKLELGEALSSPGSAADLLLAPRDRIITFGITGERQAILADLVAELQAQASFDNPAAVVTVEGSVRYPGAYPYAEGMSVGDLVHSAGGLLENADSGYALVVRKTDNQGNIRVEDAIASSLSIESGKPAQRGDTLLVFDATAPREGLLADTLELLRQQSDAEERSRIVRASGQVRFPGEYPLTPGMTVAGLLRAAGGFTESAVTSQAELTRYEVRGADGREVTYANVSLAEIDGRNQTLQAFDTLVVRQLPNWVEPETIQISGEVVSPGTYSIAKGDTLSSVLARAGGLTGFADANASVLLRADLREREQQLLTQYREELESDLSAVALEADDSREQAETLAIGESLLEQVEDAEALGRLVINLPRILEGFEDNDVIVRNGDQLFIPRQRQEVTILGEVFQPTSHLYDDRLDVADYIDLSGGITQRADLRRTYVIKADGQVVSLGGSRWFFQPGRQLGPGDTIVVPFDLEPTDNLATWGSVSQILFNLATAVLAINSVQN